MRSTLDRTRIGHAASGILALFVASTGLAGCGDPEPPDTPPGALREEQAEAAREWPEGTVLAVDDLPIRAEDVRVIADSVAEIYPGDVEAQHLRLSLTNHVLESFAVSSRDRVERERVLEECRRVKAALDAGEEPPGMHELNGGPVAMGLGLWALARNREPGVWSEPIEVVGRWVLVRLEERITPEDTRREWVKVSLYSLPYVNTSYRAELDVTTSIAEAVDGARLEIVDPDWNHYVPAQWKHRMGALDTD